MKKGLGSLFIFAVVLIIIILAGIASAQEINLAASANGGFASGSGGNRGIFSDMNDGNLTSRSGYGIYYRGHSDFSGTVIGNVTFDQIVPTLSSIEVNYEVIFRGSVMNTWSTKELYIKQNGQWNFIQSGFNSGVSIDGPWTDVEAVSFVLSGGLQWTSPFSYAYGEFYINEIEAWGEPCSQLTCADNYSGQCGSALDDGCGGTLNCSTNCGSGKTCQAGFCTCGADDTIMKLSQSTGALGALWNDTTYNYNICYEDIFGSSYTEASPHECDNNRIISLNNTENAYASVNNTIDYDIPVCYGNLECRAVGGCNDINYAALSNGAIAEKDLAGYDTNYITSNWYDGNVTHGIDESRDDYCGGGHREDGRRSYMTYTITFSTTATAINTLIIDYIVASAGGNEQRKLELWNGSNWITVSENDNKLPVTTYYNSGGPNSLIGLDERATINGLWYNISKIRIFLYCPYHDKNSEYVAVFNVQAIGPNCVPGSCDINEETVVRLSQDTNSLISNASDTSYPIKICCKRGEIIPSTERYWTNMKGEKITNADIEDTVLMVYSGVSQAYDFDIWEDDITWGFPHDDKIKTSVSSFLKDEKAIAKWIINPDDFEEQTSDYEHFFFIVDSERSPDLNVSENNYNNSVPKAKIIEPVEGNNYIIRSATGKTETIDFIQDSEDEDDDLKVLWDFDDKTNSGWLENCLTTGNCNTNHDYDDPGTKDIVLQAEEMTRRQTSKDTSRINVYKEGLNVFVILEKKVSGKTVLLNATKSFVSDCYDTYGECDAAHTDADLTGNATTDCREINDSDDNLVKLYCYNRKITYKGPGANAQLIFSIDGAAFQPQEIEDFVFFTAFDKPGEHIIELNLAYKKS